MDSGKGSAQYVETQLPEWEHVAADKINEKHDAVSKPQRSTKTAIVSKLDAVLPRHKKYIGLSRNAFLWAIFAVFLALLVLIIGLGVGLSHGSRYD